MITILQRGEYVLAETKGGTKLLVLGDEQYIWLNLKRIGEIIMFTNNTHHLDHVLATGTYRLCDVFDEPKLSDQQHLELNVGYRKWQGYLLLTGLPTEKKKRSRIIPTHEVISVPQDAAPREVILM